MHTENVFTPYGYTVPATSNAGKLYPFSKTFVTHAPGGRWGMQYTPMMRSGGFGFPFKPSLPKCQSGTCPPWKPPGFLMTTASGPHEYLTLMEYAHWCTTSPQTPSAYTPSSLTGCCVPDPRGGGYQTPGLAGEPLPEYMVPQRPPGGGLTSTPERPPERTPERPPGRTPERPPERPPSRTPTMPGVTARPTPSLTAVPGRRPQDVPPQRPAPVPNPMEMKMRQNPKEWSSLGFGRRAQKWTRASNGCSTCRIKADPAGFTTGLSVAGRKPRKSNETKQESPIEIVRASLAQVIPSRGLDARARVRQGNPLIRAGRDSNPSHTKQKKSYRADRRRNYGDQSGPAGIGQAQCGSPGYRMGPDGCYMAGPAAYAQDVMGSTFPTGPAGRLQPMGSGVSLVNAPVDPRFNNRLGQMSSPMWQHMAPRR